MSILFSQMTYEESREYFLKNNTQNACIASIIVRDGVFCNFSISLPPTDICGKQLYKCMSVCIQAFQGIEFGLQEDGIRINALEYTQEDNVIVYSWTDKYIGQNVIEFSKKKFRSKVYERVVPAQATWSWIVTFEDLAHK